MISERKFSESYTSFWREILPTGDDYIRKINLQLERFETPFESNLPPQRRSLINELSFRLFCVILSKAESKQSIDFLFNKAINKEAKSTAMYLSRFRDFQEIILEIYEEEKNEAILLAKRLITFFLPTPLDILCYPQFRGCGIIDTCEGDIICGFTLYEIKSGDRFFRLLDLKQILIYCALNYPSQEYKIEQISLINPRLGVFFLESLDNVSFAVSGAPANHLLSEIIEFVSKPMNSR